jgi:hypothetical protein
MSPQRHRLALYFSKNPLPQPLPLEPRFKRPCGNCQIEAYTEIEYPLDVPLLCVETRETEQGGLL